MKEVEDIKKRGDLTDDQIKFLVACRESDPIVVYSEMIGLWERAGWGKISEPTMLRIYRKYKFKK